MKILFDNQIFVMHDRGGISRLFSELIINLERLSNVCIVPFMISNNIFLKKINEVTKISYLRYFKLKNHFQIINYLPSVIRRRKRTLLFFHNFLYLPINIINRLSNIFFLKFTNYDIYHPTYYDTTLLKYINKKAKLIITIHDMIDELFERNPINSKNKRIMIEKADHVIAVSQNTKTDIIRLYNIPQNKITVIYHGSSILEENNNNEKIEKTIIDILPKKYLLYVGSRDNYKNFIPFCEVFSKIIFNYPDLNVVCVGGELFSSDEITLLKKLKIFDRFFRFDVNDSTLFYIYKNAQMLIYPSLYEGFGIPILEAFSAKCPVVSSNRSSLKEVGGEAVQYFDPEDEKSMIDGISNILSDNKRRLELINFGLERLKNFSWEKNARETLTTYKKILNIK